MKKPFHNLYICIPEGSTLHYTLLNTPTIIHTKTFFVPSCHPRKKILSETKLSHSSLIHPRALHTPSSNSKYDSKIDSIKSDHSPLGRLINESIQPHIRVGSFSSWSNHKQFDSTTNSNRNISPFYFFKFRVRVRVRIWVQSATRLQ